MKTGKRVLPRNWWLNSNLQQALLPNQALFPKARGPQLWPGPMQGIRQKRRPILQREDIARIEREDERAKERDKRAHNDAG